jgi:ABC-type transport system involved in multi-copper enzyme maturation permease subunit
MTTLRAILTRRRKFPPATSLFRKELRQLLPVFCAFLGLQGAIYFLLFLLPVEGVGGSSPLHLFAGAAAGLLGLFGALFFSLELEQEAAPFLLRLPVSRGRILRAKLVAAFTVWSALILASALLFVTAQWFWEPLSQTLGIRRYLPTVETARWTQQWEWYVSIGLLSYTCCALCSLRESNVVLTFIYGMLLTAAVLVVVFSVGFVVCMGTHDFEDATPGARAYVAGATLVLSAFIFRLLWRRFNRMEERPEPAALGQVDEVLGQVVRLRFNVKGSWGVELQQKWKLWGLLFGAPVVAMLVIMILGELAPGPLFLFDLAYDEFFYVFLAGWPTVPGIICGVTLWSRAETDGAAHLLHQLPLSRRRLLAQRLLGGSAIVLICLAECSAMLFVMVPSIDQRPIATVKAEDLLLGWLVCPFVGFLVGALLSPLQRGKLSTFVLATIVTISLAAPTCFIWLGRALEPGVNKKARVAAVCIGLVCWTLLVNLVDVIDLLYLIGIDLYRWL